MSEQDFNTVRSLGFALAVAIAFGLQRSRPHARLTESWRANGGLWAVNLVVLGSVCGACVCTAARWAETQGVGLLALTAAPRWLAVATSVLALDLVSYLWHRANHLVPFLWRFHRVHHSDVAFTVSTAARFHPGELLLSLPLRIAAVVLLGAPVAGVLLFELLFNLANLVEHGDTDLPAALERALARGFITPALHRLHHSRRWSDLDTNFGTIFAVWDRLFATHLDNTSSRELETGLPGMSEPTGFLDALLLPVARRGR